MAKCDCIIYPDGKKQSAHCPREATITGSDGHFYCETHFALMQGYLKISGTQVKGEKRNEKRA